MTCGRWVLLPLCGLLSGAVLSASPALASFKYLKPGMEAGDFALEGWEGQEITLASLKRSPASLLVFWATWSPRSEPALRESQALMERYREAGLRVLAVNVDRPSVGVQERAQIDQMVGGLGLTVPVALDPGFAASSSIGVVANPAFALLDARGVLVWDASGWSAAVRESLRGQLEGLLGAGPAGAAAAAVPRGHVPAHKALLNFNLGRTFLRQGNEAKARALFESAAELDPGWAAPRSFLGHLLLQKGGASDVRQAEEMFRSAVALDSGDVPALTGLGEALLISNRDSEAAGFLEKACSLDPSFTPAIVGRARVLSRLGRPGEALALFEAALELSPRDATVFAGRAACREATGALGEAAGDYRQAVEILIGAR